MSNSESKTNILRMANNYSPNYFYGSLFFKQNSSWYEEMSTKGSYTFKKSCCNISGKEPFQRHDQRISVFNLKSNMHTC